MDAAATTGKSQHAPTLSAGETGIKLVLEPRTKETAPLIVHGVYRVPWDMAKPIAVPRHRALVLVIQNGPLFSIGTPFEEQILFAGDEQDLVSGPEGYFSLDIFALQGGRVPGDYHVFCSLANQVSNVIKARVD